MWQAYLFFLTICHIYSVPLQQQYRDPMLLESHFWPKSKTNVYKIREVRASLGDTLYPTHGHTDQNSRIYGGCRGVAIFKKTPCILTHHLQPQTNCGSNPSPIIYRQGVQAPGGTPRHFPEEILYIYTGCFSKR